MGKSNRVVLTVADFNHHELLALSKCAPSAAVKIARTKAKRGFEQIDITVRLVGDIEVGKPERTPEKFDGSKYLVAALALLTDAQRKAVYGRPIVKKKERAVIKSELDALKAKLPKHKGPPKLTPHLTVTRIKHAAEPVSAEASPENQSSANSDPARSGT